MSPEREPTPKRYPYHPLEGVPLYDEALETLYDSKKDGEPHIPTFARRMLKELTTVGLLHSSGDEAPSNIRKVSLGGDQELWIRLDTRRDDEGYMAIEVVDAPRSDAAILAAMVAWLAAEPIDLKKALAASSIEESTEVQARLGKAEALHKRILEKDQNISFEEFAENFKFLLGRLSLLEAQRPLEYLMTLVEHYKPQAKDYSGARPSFLRITKSRRSPRLAAKSA